LLLTPRLDVPTFGL
jgi:hypothetical protein